MNRAPRKLRAISSADDGAIHLRRESEIRRRSAHPLLSSAVARALAASVTTLQAAGAHLVTGGQPAAAPGHRFSNTLLRVSDDEFLLAPETLQTEAFGNAALFVVVRDGAQMAALLTHLEGNLTGCFYSDSGGSDDALNSTLEPLLRARVGRQLNDKMPTGVAVSPAMNHGGAYPGTGHPGFTAVGIPASLRRVAQLLCYDNVRGPRLPPALGDKNPHRRMWRLVDGQGTQRDIGA